MRMMVGAAFGWLHLLLLPEQQPPVVAVKRTVVVVLVMVVGRTLVQSVVGITVAMVLVPMVGLVLTHCPCQRHQQQQLLKRRVRRW